MGNSIEAMDSIRVALVDDDTEILTSLSTILDNLNRLACVAACDSVKNCLPELKEKRPDIILLDVHLRGHSGIEAIPELRSQIPDARIVMHSNYDDEDKVRGAYAAGAAGYLLKNYSAQKLQWAIEQVHSGSGVWPAAMDWDVPEADPSFPAVVGKLLAQLRYWFSSKG